MTSEKDLKKRAAELKEEIQKLMRKAEGIKDDARTVVDEHSSMMASDDQYDDPELWWARPIANDMASLMFRLDDILFYDLADYEEGV